MFLALTTIFAIVLWNNVDAKMPPVEGNCTETFIDIFPPDVMFTGKVMKPTNDFNSFDPHFVTVMFTGKVMKHTNDFNPFDPHCVTMKMARRASFNSNFRLELSSTLVDTATEMRNDFPVLMADVAVKANRPLSMQVGDQAATPPTLMITHLDKELGCYTAWSCIDMKGSAQKLAWVVCKDNDVDSAAIDQLLDDLSQQTEIDKEHFVDTKIDLC